MTRGRRGRGRSYDESKATSKKKQKEKNSQVLVANSGAKFTKALGEQVEMF
jgi:hypothetical protein